MKKVVLMLVASMVLTACAEHIQHVKNSSADDQSKQTASIDGQERMHRILPYEFTLNGHIQPNGQYGNGLGGGF
jgi:outer membrane biogenesis lipoprotein LolB